MARDYVEQARQYEGDVIAGRTPACKWVRLACERNRRDLGRQETSGFPYRFDQGKAHQICEFAERLPHVKGPKAQRTGEFYEGSDGRQYAVWATIELEPWQCWMLTTIFGWVRVADGLRRFRIAFPLVPRKNAKSTIGAIVVLFMLTLEGEIGAECYSAATTRDQAKAVAEIAWGMAKQSRAFCEFFGIRIGSETSKSLFVPGTQGKFLPLSADANSLDGLNVLLAVIDELHAHKTRGVWDVLDTATGARLQPLLFPITTAGVLSSGICYEKLQYLQKVLEGTIEDETFFGVYYTIDEGDDWTDPLVHRKANPNYGVSVQPDDLLRKSTAAAQSQDGINNFLTKHLNVWVKAESSWMPMAAWHACARPDLSLEQLKGYPCWIGVDLAEVRDITAVVALFQLPEGRYAAIGKFFLPEAAVDASPISQYPKWVSTGNIIETDGNAADYQQIEDAIYDWCQQLLQVRMVCFDRALAAQMGQSLERRLGDRPPVVTVNQGVDILNPAMWELERLVVEGKFLHTGDEVYGWMMSNVVVHRNHKNEIYPRKAGGKDSANKIDGVSATLTALSQAMAQEPEPVFQVIKLGGR